MAQRGSCDDTSGGIANPTGELSWYDAMKWAAGLEHLPCGLTDGSTPGDWRLPTKTEWMAMVAYAKSQAYTYPALTNGAGTAKWSEGNIFAGVATSHIYWSSTSDSGSTSSAWTCAMWNGNMGMGGVDKSIASIRVWPVRGGQSGTFGSLRVE